MCVGGVLVVCMGDFNLWFIRDLSCFTRIRLINSV